MADIAAPYTTANDINSQPGNAALGGGEQHDPNDKNPFGILGQTILNLNQQAAEKEKQRRQQIFENQQQERRFQNDTSSRIQQYALQNSLNQQEANRKFIQQVYNTGDAINPYNHADANGNQTSLTPPDGHQDQLASQAKSITQAVLKSPLGTSDPDVQEQFAKLRQNTKNSGAAAAQLAALKIELSQTSDPQARANLQKNIDEINNSKVTDPVKSYQPIPLDIKLLPEGAEIDKMVKDKSMQSVTDENDDQKLAIPVSYVAGIPSIQPNTADWRRMQNTVNLFKGTTPGNTIGPDMAATDPTKFTQLQDDANKMADIYHIPHPNLGQVVQDQNGKPKIVLNPDDRQVAYGINLQKAYFNLKDDPDAPSSLDVEEQKAKIAKDLADAQEKKTGKDTKTIIAERAAQEGGVAANTTVYNNFKNWDATGTTPTGDLSTKITANLKSQGYDPSKYNIKIVPTSTLEANYLQQHKETIMGGNATDIKIPNRTYVLTAKSGKPKDNILVGEYDKVTGTGDKAKTTTEVVAVPAQAVLENSIKAGEKGTETQKYLEAATKEFGREGNIWETGKEPEQTATTTTSTTKGISVPSRPTNLPAKAYYSAKLKRWIDPNTRSSYDDNGKIIPAK